MGDRAVGAPAAAPPADAVGSVVGLARTLRAAGVAATPDRVAAFVAALGTVDVARRSDVYWCGRLTLCGHHDDVDRYDRAFATYFGLAEAPVAPARRTVVRTAALTLVAATEAEPASAPADEEAPAATRAATASAAEVLRTRDIATLGPAERAALNRLLAACRLPGEPRRSRRHRPQTRGDIDPRRTVRALLRSGGEPARLRRRGHRERARRVVLLVDVSGSMSRYADALLRFAHAASRGTAPAEVFTIGTRLTRVTREISHRDPDLAMTAVAAAVPDWSGGTRLGDLLKAFLDRYGQRGMARGAVVVVLSDGWERGDPTLLAEQMERLGRLAHRVVWANPRRGRPGYEPTAAGMAAALPHVDDFVAGHSLEALEALAAVVAGHRRGPVREAVDA